MQGARPFTADEVRQIVQSFSGRHQARNRALFLLGIGAGFRISEMLALRIKNMARNEKVFPLITVQRKNMKATKRSRTVELHPETRAAVSVWLDQMPKLIGEVSEDTPLFCSRVRNPAWHPPAAGAGNVLAPAEGDLRRERPAWHAWVHTPCGNICEPDV